MGASVLRPPRLQQGPRGRDARSKTVAVIGDSTFMHSGMTGLTDIAYNQSNSTVIILDNSITGMTGHQQNPTTGKNLRGDPAGKVNLEALCRASGLSAGCGWWTPMTCKATDTGAEGGAGRGGAVGDHHPPPLRDAEGGDPKAPPLTRWTRKSATDASLCMRIGCAGPQSPRGPRGNRQHPVHWLPGVHADVPPGRLWIV